MFMLYFYDIGVSSVNEASYNVEKLVRV